MSAKDLIYMQVYVHVIFVGTGTNRAHKNQTFPELQLTVFFNNISRYRPLTELRYLKA